MPLDKQHQLVQYKTNIKFCLFIYPWEHRTKTMGQKQHIAVYNKAGACRQSILNLFHKGPRTLQWGLKTFFFPFPFFKRWPRLKAGCLFYVCCQDRKNGGQRGAALRSSEQLIPWDGRPSSPRWWGRIEWPASVFSWLFRSLQSHDKLRRGVCQPPRN